MSFFYRLLVAALAVGYIFVAIAAPVPREVASIETRDVIDTPALEERAVPFEVPEGLDARDLNDEDLALATRAFLADMTEVERRNWLGNAWNKVHKAVDHVQSYVKPVTSILHTASKASSMYGGAKGKKIAGHLNKANRAIKKGDRAAKSLGFRSLEEDELDLD